VTPEKPRGVIAGAMDDGHLNIWDVNSILSGSTADGASSLIASNLTHQGAIKAVDFNPVNPKLLMSAGSGGEVSTKSVNFLRVFSSTFGIWRNHLSRILPLVAVNGWTISKPPHGTEKSPTFLRQQARMGSPQSGTSNRAVKSCICKLLVVDVLARLHGIQITRPESLLDAAMTQLLRFTFGIYEIRTLLR
jgi:WD40 repeat protein